MPEDQVQPFSDAQIQALLKAAADTPSPDRNRAIILVLVDTGLRASELCSLRVGDANHVQGELVVVGKGNKRRSVYMGATARRAVKRYVLRYRAGADPDEPLFVSEGGTKIGTQLHPDGLRLMLHKLGATAGVEGVRCSPHTLRDTFAVSYLRNGGNLLELQRLLGHSDVEMVKRYVKLAESDLAKAHRQASPADRLGLR